MGNTLCSPDTESNIREEEFFNRLTPTKPYGYCRKGAAFPLTQMVQTSLSRSNSNSSNHSSASTVASPPNKMRRLPIGTNHSKVIKLLPIEEQFSVDENEFEMTIDQDFQTQLDLSCIVETEPIKSEENISMIEENQKEMGRQDPSNGFLNGKCKEKDNIPEEKLDRKGKEINEGQEDDVQTKQVRGWKTGLS